MPITYDTNVIFVLDETEEVLFEISGLSAHPVKGDIIFLNDMKYSVELTEEVSAEFIMIDKIKERF